MTLSVLSSLELIVNNKAIINKEKMEPRLAFTKAKHNITLAEIKKRHRFILLDLNASLLLKNRNKYQVNENSNILTPYKKNMEFVEDIDSTPEYRFSAPVAIAEANPPNELTYK